MRKRWWSMPFECHPIFPATSTSSIFNKKLYARLSLYRLPRFFKKWMLCLSVQPSFNFFQNSLNLWKILLEVWPIPSQTCSIWHDMAGKWATEVNKSIDHFQKVLKVCKCIISTWITWVKWQALDWKADAISCAVSWRHTPTCHGCFSPTCHGCFSTKVVAPMMFLGF